MQLNPGSHVGCCHFSVSVADLAILPCRNSSNSRKYRGRGRLQDGYMPARRLLLPSARSLAASWIEDALLPSERESHCGVHCSEPAAMGRGDIMNLRWPSITVHPLSHAIGCAAKPHCRGGEHKFFYCLWRRSLDASGL